MKYEIGSMVFNDWQIVREIGSGASGVVWEIVKEDHDITIFSALKVIHVPQNSSVERNLYADGMDELSVTKFLQNVVSDLTDEIKIMIEMKGFPYIVNCEDYKVIKYDGAAKWDILIRMELLIPIQEFICKKQLSESDVIEMGMELLQTLSLFESRGIIHRDIKPENIFVDKYGKFKIGDFGIARICDKASADLSKKGTDNYMAPEVYHGKEYDHTVDIYSLGLVLYKFLNNNRLPFYPTGYSFSEWDVQQALIDRLGGKKEIPLPCSASQELGKIIVRMCAHNPQERYQNAEEVLNDLTAVMGSEEKIIGIFEKGDAITEEISKSLDETRSVFEKNVIIHDSDHVKKAGKTGITGEGISRELPTDETDKKDILYDKKEDNSKEKSSDSVKDNISNKRTVNRKMIIQGLALAVIVFAVVFYFMINKNYSLAVTDGSGTGNYRGGQTVTVSAEDIDGSTFAKWDVSEKLVLTEGELTSPTISFKMPRHELTIKAVYDVNRHEVVVNGGSGSGQYDVGERITIVADEPETGKEFAGWELEEGTASLQNAQKQKSSFEMPDEKIVINAVFNETDYKVSVNDGNGTGIYHYGDMVQISAKDSNNNVPFSHWTIDKGTITIADLNVKNLSFEMPAEDVALTAHYSQEKFTLKVENGKGSGMYEAGNTVTIKAEETDSSGTPFAKWEVTEGALQLEKETETEISFEMPAERTVIRAVYEAKDKYNVVVFGGSGGGVYAEGDTVTVVAEEVSGKKFNCWFITAEGSESVENDNASFSFSMPASDLIITAMYDLE